MKSALTNVLADKMCPDIAQNDLTIIEGYSKALNFGLDKCQIKVAIVQVIPKVVRYVHVPCLTILIMLCITL